MKNIILTSGLYFPNVGGIESSLYNLACVGINKGDSIKIITSNTIEGDDNLPPGETLECDIRIARYNSPANKRRSIIKAVRYVHSAIKAYKDNYDADTVVIARYHWNVIFSYMAGYRKIKYLVPGVVENQFNKNNLSGAKSSWMLYIEQFVQNVAFRLSDGIFVFSENMKEQVHAVYGEAEISIVSPGVDPNRFTNKKEFNDEITLLIVSRLVKAKGIEYAVNALGYLSEKFRLVIVGEGEELSTLKQLVVTLGVSERVTFVGKQNNPDHFYLSADIFLLPSVYEPFGQTVLEASAAGLLTVAFDSKIVLTATNDILGDHGFFCESLDAESYALKITDAACNVSTARSDEIRDYILAKYSWDKLYENLLN